MTLWPVLRPPDWPGAAHARCRPLLVHRDPSWVPWVAVARFDGPLVSYLGPDVPDAEPAAVDRLRAEPVAWTVLDDGDLPIVRIDGDHASERILDEGTLWRLGESALDSLALAVALPRSGLFLATPFSHAAALVEPARALHDAAGELRLTPRVLVVTEGRVVGVLS